MSETGRNTRGLLKAEIARVQADLDAYHAQEPQRLRSALLDEILRNAGRALETGDAVAQYNALQELRECR